MINCLSIKYIVILFIGNISFELLLWHQLIITYLTVILRKTDVELGAWICLIDFVLSISISAVCNEVLNKKKMWKKVKNYDNAE